MARIGFDFDGTLAVWPQGVRADYSDPYGSIAKCAAVMGSMKWLKACIRNGHEVVIITGRDILHEGAIRYWLLQFTGKFIDVVTRPDYVSLDEASQANWKATEIAARTLLIYVGDNHRIDKEAARMAGVRFLDAKVFRNGALPALPMNLATTRRGA